jgi:hypothetical protein
LQASGRNYLPVISSVALAGPDPAEPYLAGPVQQNNRIIVMIEGLR